MRQLLRHLVAFGVILSVLLSALGVAHSSCDAVGRVGANMVAMTDMPDMPGMPASDAPARGEGCDHDSQAPAEHGGTSTCLLVAHCGTVMVAGHADVRVAFVSIATRAPVADDAGPLDLALEPESPPPRS